MGCDDAPSAPGPGKALNQRLVNFAVTKVHLSPRGQEANIDLAHGAWLDLENDGHCSGAHHLVYSTSAVEGLENKKIDLGFCVTENRIEAADPLTRVLTEIE